MLKLLTNLEAYARDPDSKVAAVRVRTVLDEMQGIGNYVKGLVSGVITDLGCEQCLLAMAQSCFVQANASVAQLLRGSRLDENVARLAAAVSELRLSVVVLSPIACSRDAGEQLLVQTKECRGLVAVMLPFCPTLARLDRLLSDLECLVRTSVSVSRLKMQSNTANIAQLLLLSERLVAGLQSRSSSSVAVRQLMPSLIQLSSACEAVRSGLLPASKVSAAWAECHGHQKRLLADAMILERAARPLLAEQDQPALNGTVLEDALDALLVSSIRLSASAKNFFTLYVAPSCSTAESFVAACEVVTAGAARHRHRAILAAILSLASVVEAKMKELPSAAAQKTAFSAILQALDGCHSFLLVLDELEGGYSPSAWQMEGPEAQVAALKTLFDPAASLLIENATKFVASLADESMFPAEIVDWSNQVAHLSSLLQAKVEEK